MSIPRPAAPPNADVAFAICHGNQHDWNLDEPSARVVHVHERSGGTRGRVVLVRWETKCRRCGTRRWLILTEPGRVQQGTFRYLWPEGYLASDHPDEQPLTRSDWRDQFRTNLPLANGKP